jgi:putative glutamine amidotransferase
MLRLFTGMERARVNSLHGQGVDQLAPALAIEATAPDGLIEAFRMDRSDAFLLGVQWHPEWHFRDDPLSVAIFRAFGTAARAYRSDRRFRERTQDQAALAAETDPLLHPPTDLKWTA